MEVLSQAFLDNVATSNSTSVSIQNEESNHQTKKKTKKKVRKRVLVFMLLAVFLFEVFYLFVSKLGYNEFEDFIQLMTSNSSCTC